MGQSTAAHHAAQLRRGLAAARVCEGLICDPMDHYYGILEEIGSVAARSTEVRDGEGLDGRYPTVWEFLDGSLLAYYDDGCGETTAYVIIRREHQGEARTLLDNDWHNCQDCLSELVHHGPACARHGKLAEPVGV